jgi:hypothetical protein
MPRKDSVGPLVAALASVVVDHVQDDFDTGLMQRRDHLLELADLLTDGAHRAIGSVRAK